MGVSVLDWSCNPGPVKCVRVCIRVCMSHAEVRVTFLAHMCFWPEGLFAFIRPSKAQFREDPELAMRGSSQGCVTKPLRLLGFGVVIGKFRGCCRGEGS